MSDYNEPGSDKNVPKDRRTSLSAAMLRISASLDLETVLREVVEHEATAV